MKSYLYEMHAHTSEVSKCSHVKADELVKTYVNAGYTGVVITDHMSRHSFSHMDQPTWREMVDYFLEGWRKARLAAPDGFNVLLGMEINFYENGNDYLVYGLDESFLYKNEDLLHMGIELFSNLSRENGLLLYQAHPFRNQMTIVNPALLDGIEVHNGNPRHNSRNDIAAAWAQKYQLKKIGGSDFHELEDVARGGITTIERITDNASLVSFLNEEPQLIDL